MVIERPKGPQLSQRIDGFLDLLGIVVEPVTVQHGHVARQAFLNFGKVDIRLVSTSATALLMLYHVQRGSRCSTRATISDARM